jgi:hypothetical protein
MENEIMSKKRTGVWFGFTAFGVRPVSGQDWIYKSMGTGIQY